MSLVTDARYKVSQHNRTLGVSEMRSKDETDCSGGRRQLTKEQMKLQGWKEDNVDIVDEFKSMQEHLDIDNWENVRGPRPWEEDSVKYKEIIEKRVKEHEERRKKTGIFWVA